MREIVLGKTGIKVPQNAFGALPIQRVDMDMAVKLLRGAYEGGMRFFDTARAYSDSEEKMGEAFGTIEGMREKIYISSKTMAKTPEKFWEDLDTTLKNLKTDYLDIYVAEEIVESGLYETLQFPFCYLATERDIALVKATEAAGMGFLAMKGLSGGLLTDSTACMAFMSQYNALPLWGIQREEELAQWLRFFDEEVEMTDEIAAFIEEDRKNLMGDFCRGCGYCMPCTVGIQINNCARMSQLIRRSPSQNFLSEEWQGLMMKIEECVDCGLCKTKCPYELDTPNLLRKNLADYKDILAGKVQI